MANVEHSVLTGADLHESKGVAAAVANRVFVTDGAASGSFQQVPAAAIAAAGVLVFQSQKYHIRDEVSTGTASQGALTSSVWNTRRLQTEKTDDLTITLGGNQFTLPAGTYWCQGWVSCRIEMDGGAPSIAQCVSQVRLRNITDSTTSLMGPSMFNTFDTPGNGTWGGQYILPLIGQFTIGGSKVFELQNYVRSDLSVNFNAGFSSNSGENEVYADLVLWKIS